MKTTAYNFLLEYIGNTELMRFYLNQINYTGKNTDIQLSIAPLVYRIIDSIITGKSISYRHKNFFTDIKNKNILLKLVDVDKISKDFIDTIETILPLMITKLPAIDPIAELVKLFSENYIYELVEKVEKTNPLKIQRLIKLKELTHPTPQL